MQIMNQFRIMIKISKMFKVKLVYRYIQTKRGKLVLFVNQHPMFQILSEKENRKFSNRKWVLCMHPQDAGCIA